MVWTYSGNIVGILFQLVIGVALARQLSPSAFGLMAIAGILLGFGRMISDVGLGPALIQRQNLAKEDIRFVFWCQIMVGIILGTITYFTAEALSHLFDNPNDLTEVIQALAVIFIIQAAGLTAEHLLRRNVNFKAITITQISTYAVSFGGIGLTAAFYGYGVWSLVAANISHVFLMTVILMLICRHPIAPIFSPKNKDILKFGIQVVATNFLNWAITAIDTFFIGRVGGTTMLGLYNRAQFLVLNPTTKIATSLQRVMFSAYSRAQDEIETTSIIFLASVTFVSLALMPLLLTIAIVPETVLVGLFGSQWQPATIFITPLSIAMVLHGLMTLAGPLVWGKGRIDLALRAQGTTLIAFVAIMLWASEQSIQIMAWGVVSAYLVRYILLTKIALDLLFISWHDILRSILGPVLVSTLTAFCIFGFDRFLNTTSLSPEIKLILEIPLGLLCTILGTVLFKKAVFTIEVIWLLKRIAHRIPDRVKNLLLKFRITENEL